jgi:rubredoxin
MRAVMAGFYPRSLGATMRRAIMRAFALPGFGKISMKSYMCVICGFVYEEEKGRPEEGIAPGTPWDDVPENWKCPECGATKSDFEMVEI